MTTAWELAKKLELELLLVPKSRVWYYIFAGSYVCDFCEFIFFFFTIFTKNYFLPKKRKERKVTT